MKDRHEGDGQRDPQRHDRQGGRGILSVKENRQFRIKKQRGDKKKSITPPIPSEWMGLAEEMTISSL